MAAAMSSLSSIRCSRSFQAASSQISAKEFNPTMVAVFFSPACARRLAGISTRPWPSGSHWTALAYSSVRARTSL